VRNRIQDSGFRIQGALLRIAAVEHALPRDPVAQEQGEKQDSGFRGRCSGLPLSSMSSGGTRLRWNKTGTLIRNGLPES